MMGPWVQPLLASVSAAAMSTGGGGDPVLYEIASGTTSFLGGTYAFRGNIFTMNANRGLISLDVGFYASTYDFGVCVAAVDGSNLVTSILHKEAYGISAGDVTEVILSETVPLVSGNRYVIGIYRTAGAGTMFFRADTSPEADPNGHFTFVAPARAGVIPVVSTDVTYSDTLAHWINMVTV